MSDDLLRDAASTQSVTDKSNPSQHNGSMPSSMPNQPRAAPRKLSKAPVVTQVVEAASLVSEDAKLEDETVSHAKQAPRSEDSSVCWIFLLLCLLITMQSDEDVELEEGTYVVERILDAYQHGMWFIRLPAQTSPRAVSQRRHQQKSTMFYYVKWQGYDDEDDCTWESEVCPIAM
jgi:hypothetical protein